jgi:hypothetical protein
MTQMVTEKLTLPAEPKTKFLFSQASAQDRSLTIAGIGELSELSIGDGSSESLTPAI